MWRNGRMFKSKTPIGEIKKGSDTIQVQHIDEKSVEIFICNESAIGLEKGGWDMWSIFRLNKNEIDNLIDILQEAKKKS